MLEMYMLCYTTSPRRLHVEDARRHRVAHNAVSRYLPLMAREPLLTKYLRVFLDSAAHSREAYRLRADSFSLVLSHLRVDVSVPELTVALLEFYREMPRRVIFDVGDPVGVFLGEGIVNSTTS